MIPKARQSRPDRFGLTEELDSFGRVFLLLGSREESCGFLLKVLTNGQRRRAFGEQLLHHLGPPPGLLIIFRFQGCRLERHRDDARQLMGKFCS